VGRCSDVAKGELTTKGPFAKIVAHQYADTNGIDRDVFYGTRQDWIDLAVRDGQVKTEEEQMATGIAPEVVGHAVTIPVPKGTARACSIAFDSPDVLTYRVAAHSQGGGGEVQKVLRVGGPVSSTDKWPKKAVWEFPNAKDVDWVSIELVDGDPTKVNANGKTVRPGFNISA
jgi:hypothetical protein